MSQGDGGALTLTAGKDSLLSSESLFFSGLSVSPIMNSMKLVIPLHSISSKKIPNDAVTLQRQSQFTPKMKANAVPRLLSSLV